METLKVAAKENDELLAIIGWKSFTSIDKQSESIPAAMCTSEVLNYIKMFCPRFKGLIKYLTWMNHLYYPIYERSSLEEIRNKLSIVIEDVKELNKLLEDLKDSTSYTLPKDFVEKLEFNLETTEYCIEKQIDYDPHLLTTNLVEGCFGDMRAILKRFNAMQFLMLISAILNKIFSLFHEDSIHNPLVSQRSAYRRVIGRKLVKLPKELLRVAIKRIPREISEADVEAARAVCFALRSVPKDTIRQRVFKIIKTSKDMLKLSLKNWKCSVVSNLRDFDDASREFEMCDTIVEIKAPATKVQSTPINLFEREKVLNMKIPKSGTVYDLIDIELASSSPDGYGFRPLLQIDTKFFNGSLGLSTWIYVNIVEKRLIRLLNLPSASEKFIKEAPEIDNVLKELVERWKLCPAERIVILAWGGYAAERAYLSDAFEANYCFDQEIQIPEKVQILDLIRVFKKRFTEMDGFSLKSACSYFGIEQKEELLHNAKHDNEYQRLVLEAGVRKWHKLGKDGVISDEQLDQFLEVEQPTTVVKPEKTKTRKSKSKKRNRSERDQKDEYDETEEMNDTPVEEEVILKGKRTKKVKFDPDAATQEELHTSLGEEQEEEFEEEVEEEEHSQKEKNDFSDYTMKDDQEDEWMEWEEFDED